MTYDPNPKEKNGAMLIGVAIILTCLLLANFFCGCGATQTMIEPRTLDTTPPHLRDSIVTRDSIIFHLVPVTVPRDSVVVRDSVTFVKTPFHLYTGSKISDRGDTLKAKFDSYTKKISLDIGYAKQSTAYQDTTHSVKPPDIVEFPLLSKIGLGATCFVIGAIFTLVGCIALKFVKPL
jgi:hypothetical protein